MAIIDIIILVIIGIFALVGLKNGFIKSLFGLLGGILAIVVAYLLTAKAVGFVCGLVNLGGAPLDQFLANIIEGTIVNLAGDQADLLTALPPAGGFTNDYVVQCLNAIKIPGILSGIIAPAVTASVAGQTIALAPCIAGILANLAISAVCFIILWVIALIVISLIKKLLTKLFNLPVLGLANRLLGLLFGAIKGVVVIWVVLFVVSLVGFISEPVNNLIATSTITKFIADNNVVVMFVSKGMDFGSIVQNVVDNAKGIIE